MTKIQIYNKNIMKIQ